MNIKDEICSLEELLKYCFNELLLQKENLKYQTILIKNFFEEIKSFIHLKQRLKKGSTKRGAIEIFVSDAKTFRGKFDESTVRHGYNKSKEILLNELQYLKELKD